MTARDGADPADPADPVGPASAQAVLAGLARADLASLVRWLDWVEPLLPAITVPALTSRVLYDTLRAGVDTLRELEGVLRELLPKGERPGVGGDATETRPLSLRAGQVRLRRALRVLDDGTLRWLLSGLTTQDELAQLAESRLLAGCARLQLAAPALEQAFFTLDRLGTVRSGELAANVPELRVTYAGAMVEMRGIDAQVLALRMANGGTPVTHRQLAELLPNGSALSGKQIAAAANRVDAHVVTAAPDVRARIVFVDRAPIYPAADELLLFDPKVGAGAGAAKAGVSKNTSQPKQKDLLRCATSLADAVAGADLAGIQFLFRQARPALAGDPTLEVAQALMFAQDGVYSLEDVDYALSLWLREAGGPERAPSGQPDIGAMAPDEALYTLVEKLERLLELLEGVGLIPALDVLRSAVRELPELLLIGIGRLRLARDALKQILGHPAGRLVVTLGELVVDGAERGLTLAGQRVDVRPFALDVLSLLARYAGHPVSDDLLVWRVWHQPRKQVGLSYSHVGVLGQVRELIERLAEAGVADALVRERPRTVRLALEGDVEVTYRQPAGCIRLDVDDITIDLETWEAVRDGRPLELRGNDWTTLEQLLLDVNCVVPNERLISLLVAGKAQLIAPGNLLTNSVTHLRNELGVPTEHLQVLTVKGIGIRLVLRDEDRTS